MIEKLAVLFVTVAAPVRGIWEPAQLQGPPMCVAPSAGGLLLHGSEDVLQPGHLIDRRYVLQEMIQDLGLGTYEEAYHQQDLGAFSLPEFKRPLISSGVQPPVDLTPTSRTSDLPVVDVEGPETPLSDSEEEAIFGLALSVEKEHDHDGAESSLTQWRRRQQYRLGKQFEGGGHGQIWRAYKIMDDGYTLSPDRFVMKRMLVEGHLDIWRCGLREIHYGKRLLGRPHIARYHEHFYRNTSVAGMELWIVFYDEGVSLRRYLYSPSKGTDSVVYEPSEFWRRLRLADGGREVIKALMRQMLEGTAEVHAINATHRDLKPSNVILNIRDGQAIVKVADFSSAVDAETAVNGMYGAGPSQDEETREYAPPEVIFSSDPYEREDPQSYDAWSIGVIFLELLLGTPQVFTVDQRTRAILAHQLRRESEEARRRAYLLAALADFCVSSPEEPSWETTPRATALAPGGVYHHAGPMCTLEDLRKAIVQRDPLDKGFGDMWGLHLLSRLLRWDAKERIRPAEALMHAYFKGPYVSSIDGSEHATPQDLKQHESTMHSIKTNTDVRSKAVIKPRNGHLTTFDRAPPMPPTEEDIRFACPHCGRSFEAWDSCNAHMRIRKHGKFCSYPTDALPSCIGYHSMLPLDPHSGWCDVQGRRSGIEDFHSIVFSETYKFYGVFDGHWGTKAAKFASRSLHANIETAMESGVSLREAVRRAFRSTNEELRRLTDGRDHSGTTASIAMVFSDRLLVANVGDSRAILCCDEQLRPVQLTVDHTASLPEERRRVERLGGTVEMKGVWRVEGRLALSRSIGDFQYDQVLSREPHVVVKKLGPRSQFLILASDGLWDVMSNEEAVDMVIEKAAAMRAEAPDSALDYHVLARFLTWEAYVRGSSDNIGVCIISLHPSHDHAHRPRE